MSDRSTTITTSQIKDGTLLPTDLHGTNSPADNQVASYDESTGFFTWVAVAGGVSVIEDLTDVDFVSGTPIDNQVLRYDAGSGKWRAETLTPGISDIVEDTTPQLGGDLDLNGKNIDFPTTPNISDCLDEDNMVSDSATKLATQQSIKKYVDDNTNIDDFTIKRTSNTLKIADRIEQNIMLNAFRVAINGSLSVQNMVDGIVDEFEDETGVDTGNSTNEDYDSVNDLYKPTATSPSYVASITQEVRNDYGQQGDVGGQERRNAQSFTLSEEKDINAIGIELTSSIGSPYGDVTMRIETDNAGVPSGTLAHANATKAMSVTASQWNKFDFASSFSLSSGTYWIVFTCNTQATTNYWSWYSNTSSVYAGGNMAYSTDAGSSWTVLSTSDMTFRVYTLEPGETNNMTLISNNTEAEEQPDNARLVILEKDITVITLNSNFFGEVSRDDGTTWSAVTLEDAGDYNSTVRILTGTVDISGQPADKTMRYRIRSTDTDDYEILGCGFLWD